MAQRTVKLIVIGRSFAFMAGSANDHTAVVKTGWQPGAGLVTLRAIAQVMIGGAFGLMAVGAGGHSSGRMVKIDRQPTGGGVAQRTLPAVMNSRPVTQMTALAVLSLRR